MPAMSASPVTKPFATIGAVSFRGRSLTRAHKNVFCLTSGVFSGLPPLGGGHGVYLRSWPGQRIQGKMDAAMRMRFGVKIPKKVGRAGGVGGGAPQHPTKKPTQTTNPQPGVLSFVGWCFVSTTPPTPTPPPPPLRCVGCFVVGLRGGGGGGRGGGGAGVLLPRVGRRFGAVGSAPPDGIETREVVG